MCKVLKSSVRKMMQYAYKSLADTVFVGFNFPDFGSVFMGTGCFVRGSVCGSAMSNPSSPRQNSSGYWRASCDRCVALVRCTALLMV